jgi:outer membrane receptor protein involved in Fe transport
VWGANALNGVVNVITKSPREMLGTSVTFGGGSMGREVNDNNADSAAIFYVRGTHAQAINDRWSYRLSLGTYVSDAFARPTGLIPNGGTTSYPNYKNDGTQQPKIDVRVDYDFADPSKKLQFAAGVAGTDGMMHTGIGPFDISSGAKMGYWRGTYTKNALKVQAFMNMLARTPPTSFRWIRLKARRPDVQHQDVRFRGRRHRVADRVHLRRQSAPE